MEDTVDNLLKLMAEQSAARNALVVASNAQVAASQAQIADLIGAIRNIKGHITSDCRKLKAKLAKAKQIKSVSHESEDFSDDFGAQAHSNTICLVDNKNVIIDAFVSKTKAKDHPLATIPPIKTCLGLEGIGNLKFEVDNGASHNIISKNVMTNSS